jgi:hypothetical protein
MNDQDVENINKSVGKNLGQIATAIIIIVKVLKRQPHFDSAAFDQEIGAFISHAVEDEISKDILTRILENPPESQQCTPTEIEGG